MALKWGLFAKECFFSSMASHVRGASASSESPSSRSNCGRSAVFFGDISTLALWQTANISSMVSTKKLCCYHSQRFCRLVSYVCTYVHMPVCIMHVRAYARMHVCTYARMHVCTYVRMHVCIMHVCTYARMHVCILHVRTYVRMHVCTYALCTYAHMHVCTYACMHVRIMHVCTYARM